MPRAGGVYSLPPGSTAVPNTTVASAAYNTVLADLAADANAARPIGSGGSGATNAIAGNDNFNTFGADLVSASTVNLANATGVISNVTGSVTITGLGTVGAGSERVLIFASALTLTHNATSLILPGAANIVTAAGDTATFRSLGGGNWKCIDYVRAASAPYSATSTETLKNKSLEDNTTFIVDETDATKKLKFQVAGITTGTTRTVTAPDKDGTMLLSTAQQLVAGFRNLKVSISSATQVVITADALTVEDSSSNSVRLAAVNVTADITASGANGLDTGAEAASAWYYGWVCWNGTTTIGLISASATAPTLPATYTHKTLVSAFRNDASSNLWRMLQFGRQAQIVIGTNPTVVPVMASGISGNPATPTWTAVAVGSFVPPIASTIIGTLSCAIGDNLRSMVAPNSSYGAWNSTNSPPFSIGIIGAGMTANILVDMILESTNFYYASNASSSQVALNGWVLNI